MPLRIALLLTAAFAASPVTAAEDDAELWTTFGAGGTVSSRLMASFEAIARFSRDEGGLYEAEYGGFVGYRMGDKVSLWAGYVRVPRYARGRSAGVEDRTRQQVAVDFGDVLGGSLSGRIRFEQRFRDGGGTGWRLRPQLRLSRPLVGDELALVLSHESFIAINDTGWGQRAGYERMRNFAGFSIPIAPRVKAEAGYLNQYNYRPGSDLIDHAAALTASYAF